MDDRDKGSSLLKSYTNNEVKYKMFYFADPASRCASYHIKMNRINEIGAVTFGLKELQNN